jgi:hypothetical protein
MGTRVKYGPVTHRIHTYSWSSRMAPPTTAQMVTRFVDLTSPSSGGTALSGSLTEGALFLLDNPVMTLPASCVGAPGNVE